MDSIEKTMILRRVNIFKQLPAEILLSIAEDFVLNDMAKGQIIYQAQEPANGLYVVVSGEINLMYQQKVVSLLKPDECFGVIALFDNLVRPLMAKANTDGSYLFLNKEAFERLVDDYPDIMHEVTRTIIRQFKLILDIKSGTQDDKRKIHGD
jgi:CRP-like cAMP-binding protein